MTVSSAPARVFCLSMPCTGTASLGRFCRDFGLRTALAPALRSHRWTAAWHAGDFEAIFSSREFADAQVVAGAPWWLPDFYKVAYQRYPDARFVLLTREPSVWFASMLEHARGQAPGDSRLHAKAFRRELEFLRLLRAGEIDDRIDDRGRRLPLQGAHAGHYSEIYRLHNSEVLEFFARHAPAALHWGELEDPRLWPRLGNFLGIEVPFGYRCHVNTHAVAPLALALTGT
ncbi:MAG: sulfotransferase [Arenimonas sp.]